MSWQEQTNPGLFVPTTSVWEINQLHETDVKSEAFKELLVRLYQNINNIVLSLNKKDSAYYFEEEFINGQVFPSPVTASASQEGLQVFRKVIKFGALPSSTTKVMPHGLTITTNFNFTRIYGCATDPNPAGQTYIPLPYASPVAANNIELKVDNTNVSVTAGSNRSAFTTTWIVIEYLKQAS